MISSTSRTKCLGDALKVVAFNSVINASIGAGDIQSVTVDLTTAASKATIGDGWSPVCIAGWDVNTRFCVIYTNKIIGTTLSVSAYNPSGSVRSTTVNIYLLCMRTGA